jgi:D-alanine-D-alanine ligase
MGTDVAASVTADATPRTPSPANVLLLYGVHPDWDPHEQDRVVRETRRLGGAIRRRGHRVRLLEIQGNHLVDALAPFDPAEAVVLNCFEGLPGLDGGEAEIVDVLERLGFAYTGATPEAIRLSYDKPRVRSLLEENGVPVPCWAQFDEPGQHQWDLFPAIVKPAWEHCSIGVDRWAVVLDADELARRVAHVIDAYGQPALVEDFIDGREFHVPLWGNETVEMLPPVEMDFSAFGDVRDRLCSYESKFDLDSTACRRIRSRIPARLTDDEQYALEAACLLAYRLVGCRDYGRIDVRQRDGRMYVLDVNPNADLSADASIALAANKAGFCYGAMGSRLLEWAQNRAPHQ